MPKNQHPQRKLLNFENWIVGPQKFSKVRVLKDNYFHLLKKTNISNRNHGIIVMLLLGFFMNKIKNSRQFSEKHIS